MAMTDDMQDVFFSKEQLQQIVARLGAQISRDFADKNLLMISVLKGSVVFMADLMRAITVPCRIDFLSAASYHSKTEAVPEPEVRDILMYDDISGFDILIVEDIFDTGRTLQKLSDFLVRKGAKSVTLCTLLDKPARRDPSVTVRPAYVGSVVANEFVVGYGLDFDERYRNLPFIGILKPEIYSD